MESQRHLTRRGPGSSGAEGGRDIHREEVGARGLEMVNCPTGAQDSGMRRRRACLSNAVRARSLDGTPLALFHLPRAMLTVPEARK